MGTVCPIAQSAVPGFFLDDVRLLRILQRLAHAGLYRGPDDTALLCTS